MNKYLNYWGLIFVIVILIPNVPHFILHSFPLTTQGQLSAVGTILGWLHYSGGRRHLLCHR